MTDTPQDTTRKQALEALLAELEATCDGSPARAWLISVLKALISQAEANE